MEKLIYIILAVSLFACGEKTKPKDMLSVEKVEKTKEIVEIKVNAIGESMAEIAFDPKTISVPSDTRVKLTFENKSSTEGMLHNFVLVELGSGSEIASSGIKAGKGNDFIPKDKRVLAFTKICDLGEIVTIEFDAPKKGSYHYICTYPGHISMIGRFNVE